MKQFEMPKVEIVYFKQVDIITLSCTCVDCSVCPEGKDDCRCYDFAGSYTNE